MKSKHQQIKRQNSGFPRMQAVERFGSIPIVETGKKSVENVYSKIKSSNTFINWYCELAESTVLAAMDSARPVVRLFDQPIQKIDEMMCKSLDIVEQIAPSVYLPPQMMYWNTKEYVSDHVVRPVLKRAGSVKKLGTAVLDNKVSNFAADRLSGAITAADKYIDKYLPDSTDETDYNNSVGDEKDIRAIQTMHKGQRVTRKLKRRLTTRTIAEAKAIKKHSAEAIHILAYAAELIAKDPKQALQKARELWTYLSNDEPENQARPETLEELTVLLTRESARRVVHLINFTTTFISKMPKTFKTQAADLVHQFIYISDSLIKATYLDRAKEKTIQEAEIVVTKVQSAYDEIQNYTQNALERLAIFLSGRLEAEKITTNPRRRVFNNPDQTNINGVY